MTGLTTINDNSIVTEEATFDMAKKKAKAKKKSPGRPPRNKGAKLDVRFVVLLTADQKRRLKERSRRDGIDMASLVRQAINRYLETK